MSQIIYFDYAATTPVDSRVAEEMGRYLTSDGIFANASSSMHALGQAASHAIDNSRNTLANLLHCSPAELVFTSGATESNNLAIKGLANASDSPIHIISTAAEHKASLAACRALENQGHFITYLRPKPTGLIDIAELVDAIRPNTQLISLLHVNNETGVVQDLNAISKLARSQGILLHVDAAQSVGKLPVDVQKLAIDMLSVSAHKFYGPKGIGALFVRRGVESRLKPIIDGGGQELGLRSGTLPTHQIAGLGKAAEIAQAQMGDDQALVAGLSARFIDRIASKVKVWVNGSRDHAIPNILNVSFPGIDSESLLVAFRNEFALSSSSACTTGTIDASHVLRSMGIEGDRLYGGLRISFGRYTTERDVDRLAYRLLEEIGRIRSLDAQIA